MIQLIMPTRKSFIETVFQRSRHPLRVSLRKFLSEEIDGMDDVVMQPWLCVLEVDYVLAQFIYDPVNVPEVVLALKALVLVDFPIFEEFSDLMNLFLRLGLHLSIL